MLKKKQRNIVRTILRWYTRQGRSLPWRLSAGQAGNITNSYRILISEIMLQQTQVSRVLVKYPEFLKSFPTLRSLANAEQKDVVLAWRGMGYNNRAVRLHKLANVVVEQHRGRIPKTVDELLALPGVGRYTANAMLSSAFGAQRPVVDVNIRRVLSRLFWRMKSTIAMQPERVIWLLAEELLPNGNAYNWNQALMDFGATVCTARNPSCMTCPVSGLCCSVSSMKREVKAKPRNELSMDGLPNRFYRGRIYRTVARKPPSHSTRPSRS
jgi:A/G-specific adenine glycosylase